MPGAMVHPDAALRRLAVQLLADARRQGGQVHRRPGRFEAADPRQGDQVVDQAAHALAGAADALQVAAALLSEPLAEFFLDEKRYPSSARRGERRSWDTE